MNTAYNIIAVDPDEARQSLYLSLRQVSSPVDPQSPETRRIIEKLFDCLDNWPHKGVGLAAPQVGVLARIFVVNIPPARQKKAKATPDGDSDNAPGEATAPAPPPPPFRMAVINPVLTELSDDMEKGMEGCLSIPDVRGLVPRHTSLRLQAIDAEGHPIDMRVTGITARVFQHEYDHLDGILYIDRMAPEDTLEAHPPAPPAAAPPEAVPAEAAQPTA